VCAVQVSHDSSGEKPADPSRPVKRSFTIGGHRTSISLEAAFWDALKVAAVREKIPVSKLVARIDAGRKDGGLSSAVRVWLLHHARDTDTSA
jgi:predicted DNA-binding ribbon-helix-helix protein